jgi:alkanesulfonate monooxygenase SsuD/methylene tetrahydromethanopterin reductase-like flavin-dependent oxidoreductase (luciferase family)
MHEPTGLIPFWKHYDRELYLKAVQLADELGYDSFWLPEAWGYEVFGLGEACDRVEASYKDHGTRDQAAAAVTPEMIEAFSIQGDPHHCIEELRRRREYCIDHPNLSLPYDMPWPLVEMYIRLMAPKSGA